MEFESISIENFCTIKNMSLVLNQPGMFLVTGINKDAPKNDSNGSGKSLILDAICWALWGETVRGLTCDEVVARKVGKDCAVHLTFSDNGVIYKVSRHRKDTRISKPNDLRLFIDGVEKTKKMKNLQEVITNLVGFDFNTFCVMMPGAGVTAASLTDTKIKELLEKLLQTEQLADAYHAARARLSVLTNEINATESRLTVYRTQLSELEAEVKQLKQVEASFVESKALKIAEIEAKIAEGLADMQKLVERYATARDMEAALETKTSTLKDLESKFSYFETNRIAKRKQEQELFERQHLLCADTHRINTSVHDNIEQLKKTDAKCDLCLQPVTPEYIEHVTAELNAQLQELVPRLNEMQADLQALGVLHYQNKSADDAKAAAMTKELRQVSTEISELKSNIKMLHNEYTQMSSFIQKGLAYQRKLLAETQADSTGDFSAIFADKRAKAEMLVAEIVKLLTTLKTLEAEEKLCKFWVEGFSPAGLRSYMLDYITPILNDRAAYYANLLTGGELKVVFTTKTTLKDGTERDKFQILVEQEHGSDLYKGNSKGEKARADLVISMALGDLATFRTAKQLPWRFLDEPFESVDDAGNEAIIQLLNDQQGRFKTVFVVTHKQAFKNLFNKRITVVKENSESRLIQEAI